MDSRFPNTLFPVDIVTWLIGALITAGVGWLLTRKTTPPKPSPAPVAVQSDLAFEETQSSNVSYNLPYPNLVLTAFAKWINDLTFRNFVEYFVVDNIPAILFTDQKDSSVQVGIRGGANNVFHVMFLFKETSTLNSYCIFHESPKNVEHMLNTFALTLVDELTSLSIMKSTPIYEARTKAVFDTFRILAAADSSYGHIAQFADETDKFARHTGIREYLERMNSEQAMLDPSVEEEWSIDQWKTAAKGEDPDELTNQS